MFRLFLFFSVLVCISAEALKCPANEEEVGCLPCENYCIEGVLTKKMCPMGCAPGQWCACKDGFYRNTLTSRCQKDCRTPR